MGGLEKGKTAHVKLQGYINTLIPDVDQPYSIVFDHLDTQEYFQRRTMIITNGYDYILLSTDVDYILLSTDVDYTGYLHQTEDFESEPNIAHLPYQAIKPLLNHHVLNLEDDRQVLKDVIYAYPEITFRYNANRRS